MTLANVPNLAARAGGEMARWGNRELNLLSVLYSVMNPYCTYDASAELLLAFGYIGTGLNLKMYAPPTLHTFNLSFGR